MTVAAAQRFTRAHPCPICDGSEQTPRGRGERCYGFLSEDGTYAHCTRAEHAGQLELTGSSEAYAHKMQGECNCGAEHQPRPLNGAAPQATREIIATFDFQDETGALLYQEVKYRPKDFRQRRPDGHGGWTWNLRDTRLVLYRLPALLAADPDERVYIPEGPKDADQVIAGGLLATTNAMGSKKWRPAYTRTLEGRHVVLLADNDGDGRAHVQLVARSLHGTAASIKIIEFADLPEHADVSDWLDAGHTIGELKELAADAPIWSPDLTGTNDPVTAHVGEHLTDLGNAKRLVARHGGDLLFCHAWDKWVINTGRRWVVDDTAEILRRAKDMVGSIYAEAADAPDPTARKAIADHAKRSESEARITGAIALTESELGIPVRPDELDRNLWALNVNNGTIDLRTGKLLPHDPADLITKLAPVDFDPDAKCPTFEAFLTRIMGDKPTLVNYMQRLIGYTLTGITTEEIMLILWGGGDNGKTTLIEMLRDLLGDYAAGTPPETFVGRRDGTIPNDIARLKGKRFVATAEAEEGKPLSESLIKRLTGRDTISARFMRGEWFDFRPEFKPWLATNHKPTVRGQDRAIWDRLKLIPFTVTIPEAEQDKNLANRLRKELPGILAWAVRGCLQWQEDGLGAPDEVIEATGSYRAEQDTLGAFIDDECTLAENAKATAKSLYAAYRQWCKLHGEEPMTRTAFGLQLGERGLTASRGRSARWWKGIGLAAQPELENGGGEGEA